MVDQKITELTENTTLDGVDLLPTVDDPSGTPTSMKITLQRMKDWIVDSIYPVGAIYISTASTSPATLFGGTWSVFGAGKTLVSLDSGDTDFNTSQETGGAKTHTMVTSEMPSHTHTARQKYALNSGTTVALNGSQIQGGGDGIHNGVAAHYTAMPEFTTGGAGSGTAHNNLQPYIVTYMWKRTA